MLHQDGVIINSVFGNWSLIIRGDNSIDFKSSFTYTTYYLYYNDVSSPKTFNGGVVSPGISNNTIVLLLSISKTKNQFS